MRETGSVPPRLRRRLWYVVGGAVLFMTTACAEGARRPDYDAWHQSISALSLGPGGWIQKLNFIVFGAIVLSTVAIWRRVLATGRGATAVPVLTTLTGVSLVVCGLVPQDPAPGYDPMGLALGAYAPRFDSPLLRGCRRREFGGEPARHGCAFYDDPWWRGWSAYSLLMAAVMAACIVVYAVWSTASTGYAGAFERLGLCVVPIWGFTFLLRLEAGTPFMNIQRVDTTAH